jgi:hypothetical protein
MCTYGAEGLAAASPNRQSFRVLRGHERSTTTPPPLLLACLHAWLRTSNLKHPKLSPRRITRAEESLSRSLQHALLTLPSCQSIRLASAVSIQLPSLLRTRCHTLRHRSLRLCTSRAARFISPSGFSRPRLRRRALDTRSTRNRRRWSRCRLGSVVLQDTARPYLALPLSCSTSL